MEIKSKSLYHISGFPILYLLIIGLVLQIILWKIFLSFMSCTPRHHRGNAVAERAIQNLVQKILIMTHDPAHSVSWYDEIFNVGHDINTSNRISNRYSPNRLMFGFEPNEPSDLVEFHSREGRFVELRDGSVRAYQYLALENNLNARIKSLLYFEKETDLFHMTSTMKYKWK